MTQVVSLYQQHSHDFILKVCGLFLLCAKRKSNIEASVSEINFNDARPISIYFAVQVYLSKWKTMFTDIYVFEAHKAIIF